MPTGRHLPLSLTSHLPVRCLSVHRALACPPASSSRFARGRWQGFQVLKANAHDSLPWHLNFFKEASPQHLRRPSTEETRLSFQEAIFSQPLPWHLLCGEDAAGSSWDHIKPQSCIFIPMLNVGCLNKGHYFFFPWQAQCMDLFGALSASMKLAYKHT